ncbi:biosynthetic peptidoglycan transglycosylase [Pectobacterium polaris]|uniref:biosynthetic peptidoglycan transglycosylase n=1 Tax=Pectobacterium polaris TaxID=2042057 RepID=UPI001968FA06|nr:biosynthetic peptidoglycan transglycosylase [Pectobacterium polaris]MBN3215705.1 transglycosylase domain-containing protein [Pectobacterium polaris]
MILIKNSILNFFKDYKLICTYIENSCGIDFNTMLQVMVLCAEDRRFIKHRGVSIKSIFRAIIKRHGGASTINMQLVRTLTNRREITIVRKIREIALSIFIDIKFNKIDILNAYLENAYFGKNIHGVNEVLNKFFGKKDSYDISQYQCCIIASMLKRPYSCNKEEWAFKINKRVSYVISIYHTNEKSLSKEIESLKLKYKKQ